MNADALRRVTIAKVEVSTEKILANQTNEENLEEIEKICKRYDKESDGYLYYTDNEEGRRLILTIGY